ncbi:MAG: DUF1631 family protein [Pseudomonadales bacterium]|nr:DUF1631 family protein [Pseudomonadales bacterium]
MQKGRDPRNMLSALFYEATGELTKLMDGFYNNIEDGLFELAYANADANQQKRIVELMRELRFRREHLMGTFIKRVQRGTEDWLAQSDSPEYLEEQLQAEKIASRCSGHFGFLLQSIAERMAHAASRDADRDSLPISPEQISYHFVMSCRNVEFDRDAVDVVQDLFHRFVLDRLGTIYGVMNQKLVDAGCPTVRELEDDTASIA